MDLPEGGGGKGGFGVGVSVTRKKIRGGGRGREGVLEKIPSMGEEYFLELHTQSEIQYSLINYSIMPSSKNTPSDFQGAYQVTMKEFCEAMEMPETSQ